MTPDEYCQQKAAASGSSFYYSFLFLKGARRLAITALYAFCREVDDVVDETSDTNIARTQLAWWRTELQAMNAGEPTHPVTKALAPHMASFQIELRWLNEIIDGMAMDLDQDRYLDYEGLKLYCHRAAGVVGCAAAQIFGASDPNTKTYAERLGLALQLTNIIRDVGEDARRGRIYLPVEDLRQFNVSQQDILASRYSDGFAALMAFEAERASQAYQAAYDVLPAADRRDQRPGLMMAAIYATLLREIRRDRFQVLHQRVALTPIRKLLIASRTWVTSKAPLPVTRHVVVVGAGWAGLSCAHYLLAAGHQVSLMDAAPNAGGRARSADVLLNGQSVELDNGQHLLIGGYRQTLDLIGIANTTPLLKRQPLQFESDDMSIVRRGPAASV